MRNYRLIPKLRARLVENTPYEDIVIPDQQQRSASEQNGEVKDLYFGIFHRRKVASVCYWYYLKVIQMCRCILGTGTSKWKSDRYTPARRQQRKCEQSSRR